MMQLYLNMFDNSEEEEQQPCVICGQHHEQMLMLSCVHDPCINCAATHYVESEPRNSKVPSHTPRSTTAHAVDRRLNLMRPVCRNCSGCTMDSKDAGSQRLIVVSPPTTPTAASRITMTTVSHSHALSHTNPSRTLERIVTITTTHLRLLFRPAILNTTLLRQSRSHPYPTPRSISCSIPVPTTLMRN